MFKQLSLYVMALLYIGAGFNHFINPRFYLRIMPAFLPAHPLLNYAAGLAEIVLGILLCVKITQRYASWGIAAMLVIFLLVHINMLQLSYKQTHYLVSPVIAWLRLILQPVLIAWALWYSR